MSDLQNLKDLPSWVWPPDAADHIKRGLDSADVAERLAAAGLAGDLVVMDDEMADKLLSIVQSDASEQLRGSAAIALGPALEEAFQVGFEEELDAGFDGRVLDEPRVAEIQRVLRAIHGDERAPDLVRRRCLEASIRAPQDWHSAAVSAAYARGEKGWKLTGLFGMGRIAGFRAQLLESLEGDDVDLLVEAVRSTGLRELSVAGPKVLELAADEQQDQLVRCAAVEALAALETEGSEELLVSLTESDDERLAELALEALEERRVFSEPPDDAF